MDFEIYSLPVLLKMALQAGLVSYYEVDDQRALLVIGKQMHVLSPREARTFVSSRLSEWWEEERRQGSTLG